MASGAPSARFCTVDREKIRLATIVQALITATTTAVTMMMLLFGLWCERNRWPNRKASGVGSGGSSSRAAFSGARKQPGHLRGGGLFGVECGEVRGEGKNTRVDVGPKKVLPAQRDNARRSTPSHLGHAESSRPVDAEVAYLTMVHAFTESRGATHHNKR
jgi:hypothetical protein